MRKGYTEQLNVRSLLSLSRDFRVCDGNDDLLVSVASDCDVYLD